MIKRIGVLNSGGDCPGLNAVIEGVVGAATRNNWEVIGFHDGFEGLLSDENNKKYEVLTIEKCRGIRTKGGTILGTVNKGNFTIKVGVNQKGVIEPSVLEKTKKTVQNLGIDALVVIGGDGSQSTALLLGESGIPVVGVPKTIDNDLDSTDVTFGFDSAVSVVAESMDRLQTTANAHQRLMVVEIMGRHAGWITLFGGIAGNADVILIPEIPFSLDVVTEYILKRRAQGTREIMVAVSEGAKLPTGLVLKDDKVKGEVRLGGIGEIVAKELEASTGMEARACVLGHTQRGGSPTAMDRVLGTRFGTVAVDLISKGQFNHMVALKGVEMVAVPIEEAVDQLKLVQPSAQLVETARSLGICLGDKL